MKQMELIDFCTRRASSACSICSHDKECDAYLDKFHTIPFQEKKLHPERYTDEEIVMEDNSDE